MNHDLKNKHQSKGPEKARETRKEEQASPCISSAAKREEIEQELETNILNGGVR